MQVLTDLAVTWGPIILAGMGLYVSIEPPKKRWLHWVWFGAFALAGGVTATATFHETRLADSAQTASQIEQKATNKEIKDLISSVGNLSTGIAQINTTRDYQFLTNPQAYSLAHTLKSFANPSIKINVTCIMGDARACFLAKQWSAILKMASWSSNGNIDQTAFIDPPFGVYILVNNAATPDAAIIQHALLTTGISAPGQISSSIPLNEIEILFGANKSPN